VEWTVLIKAFFGLADPFCMGPMASLDWPKAEGVDEEIF